MDSKIDNTALGLSTEQIEAISQMVAVANKAPSYVYPWKDMEQDLADGRQPRLMLLGYGSLVNRVSASYTIEELDLVPAVAFGVRRVFNYQIPLDHLRYGRPANPKERAALNVVPTGQMDDMINGVLIKIPLHNVPALRVREVGYDLTPAACIEWKERDKLPFLGYVLHCPDEPRDGEVRTKSDILPHREYYRVCKEGAADKGQEFLDFWLATTYMADATTLVGHWDAEAL